MPTSQQYLNLFIQYVVELFRRYIWSAGNIDGVEDKAVFITGCDSGFGFQTALTLNEAGMYVFAGCLFPDGDGAKNLVEECKNDRKMKIIPIDISRESDVQLALEKVRETLRENDLQLHAVVNNAGISPAFEIEWGSMDTIRKVFDVNMFGTVLVTRKFLPLIRQSKGRIVNVNSLGSRYTGMNVVAYCMSKAATLTFTEGLRREVDKFNVKVISIEPAIYKTGMMNEKVAEAEMDAIWSQTDPEVRQAYGTRYFEQTKRVLSLAKPFANKNVTDVSEAIKHAVLNAYPRYTYIVANIFLKIPIILGLYFNQEETFEYSRRIANLFIGGSEPLPDGSPRDTSGFFRLENFEKVVHYWGREL